MSSKKVKVDGTTVKLKILLDNACIFTIICDAK